MLSSICQAASVGLAIAPGALSPRGFTYYSSDVLFWQGQASGYGTNGKQNPLSWFKGIESLSELW